MGFWFCIPYIKENQFFSRSFFVAIVAIITARGGSKRVPKKNIKEFCGKPIIAYSIESALKSGLFDEVMVSTDSSEIAEIAKQYGAQVPFFRSDEAASDTAMTVEVCREVLAAYEAVGRQFDYFCCLYPTAPFVTPERLQEAFSLLKEGDPGTLSVFPVKAFSHPPQRGFVLDSKKQIIRVCQESSGLSLQKLSPIYHDCGQFYFVNNRVFRDTGSENVLNMTSLAVILNEMEAQDIDTPEDWVMAELKYRLFHNIGTEAEIDIGGHA